MQNVSNNYARMFKKEQFISYLVMLVLEIQISRIGCRKLKLTLSKLKQNLYE